MQETQRTEEAARLSGQALEDHRQLAAAQAGLPGVLAPLLQALRAHQAGFSPEQQQRRRRPQPSGRGAPKQATASALRDAAALVPAAAQHAAIAEEQVPLSFALSCLVSCCWAAAMIMEGRTMQSRGALRVAYGIGLFELLQISL